MRDVVDDRALVYRLVTALEDASTYVIAAPWSTARNELLGRIDAALAERLRIAADYAKVVAERDEARRLGQQLADVVAEVVERPYEGVPVRSWSAALDEWRAAKEET